MGMGQNCTKTKLDKGIKLHKGSILQEDKIAQRQFFTKVQFCISYKELKITLNNQKKKLKDILIGK